MSWARPYADRPHAVRSAACALANPHTAAADRKPNYHFLYLAFKSMERVMGRIGKAEVAKRIGVKTRKLEYMVRDGDFPPGEQPGKSTEWLEEVVDAWLDLTFVAQRE